jgi:diacylglycerol kinase family enzyme
MLEREAFMVCIANSSQFGNNAHISPKASLRDGLLDVCIIKTFPLYLFPVLGYQMFNKTVDKSQYVNIIRGRSIRIIRERPGPIHLDGEPFEMGVEIKIELKPLSLKVLI